MSGTSRRDIEDERTRRRLRRAERGKFIVGEEGSEESEGLIYMNYVVNLMNEPHNSV